MGDFPYLDWLTRIYQEQATESGGWVDHVKAHGLANSCVSRCSTSERLHQIYEIENSWYKNKHPLTPTEHEILTKQHQQLLESYRETTRTCLNDLKLSEKHLDIDDIFSDTNLVRAEEFSQEIFSMSRKCTDGFIGVSHSIIASSVDILRVFGLAAPCEFVVIGLGSVARSEATPYSDLEYAIIVESEEEMEYFTRLAVDSYFRIGNLRETPLNSFGVEELLDDDGWPWFIDRDEGIGYRIDGITEWSGNIPTGNGLENGKCLIRTAESFMKFYKSELMKPASELADFSDFLSTTVIIYSSEGGERFYDMFIEARLAFEREEARYNPYVRKKRFHTLTSDIEKYSFLPEYDESAFNHQHNTAVKVKADIFRYPTLLATNLRVSLQLESHNPWDTYEELCKLDILSKENCQYMNIVLAVSIYIRTSAYTALRTQSVLLSLYTFGVGLVSDRYHIPLNLFVTLGCLLVPIKKSIQAFFAKGHHIAVSGKADMLGFMKNLVNELYVPKTDFMLKIEVIFFAGDHNIALKQLCMALGEHIVLNCTRFIEAIRSKYSISSSDKLEPKYIKLCCNLLYLTGSYRRSVQYILCLIAYARGKLTIVMYKVLIGDCMNRLHMYTEARDVLCEGILLVQQELELNGQLPLPTYILEELSSGRDIPARLLYIFQLTASLYHALGDTLTHLCLMDMSVDCHLIALNIVEKVIEKKPDTTKRVVAANVSHSLGKAFIEMDNLTESLKYYMRALDIRKEIYGATTNHPGIAYSYNNIGNVFYELGEYRSALQYHMEALQMYLAIYSENTNRLDIASSYYNVGEIYFRLGEYARSLECNIKALNMKKAIRGDDAIHSDIDNSYNNIGEAYARLGEYRNSLEYHIKALVMRTALCAPNSQDPGMATTYTNIGEAYYGLGDYAKAVENHSKGLSIKMAVYGVVDANHLEIGHSYKDLGDIYLKYGDYKTALSYYNRILVNPGISRGSAFSWVLHKVGEAWIGSKDYKRAYQFLKIAVRKVPHYDTELKAEIEYMLGKCCMNLQLWKHAWHFLYSALCLYESLPTCHKVRLYLARVHATTAVLLLHLMHIPQSLEQSQLALNLSNDLLADEENITPECNAVNREINSLIDALSLIKMCRVQFNLHS